MFHWLSFAVVLAKAGTCVRPNQAPAFARRTGEGTDTDTSRSTGKVLSFQGDDPCETASLRACQLGGERTSLPGILI